MGPLVKQPSFQIPVARKPSGMEYFEPVRVLASYRAVYPAFLFPSTDVGRNALRSAPSRVSRAENFLSSQPPWVRAPFLPTSTLLCAGLQNSQHFCSPTVHVRYRETTTIVRNPRKARRAAISSQVGRWILARPSFPKSKSINFQSPT